MLSVLDLGAGCGGYSRIHGELGRRVVAVDKDPLTKLKLALTPNVYSITSNALDFFLSSDVIFDTILCNHLLHLLPRYEQEKIIRYMKKFTSLNGFNVIRFLTPNGEKGIGKDDVFSLDELHALYSGWNVVDVHWDNVKCKSGVINEAITFIVQKVRS